LSFGLSLGTVVALIAALTALIVATLPVSAQSGTATLGGGAEVPAVDSPSGGSFSGTMDMSTYAISYSLQSDAADITQAHIHVGAAGENGPAAVFLFGPADPGSDGLDFTDTVTAASFLGDFTVESVGAAIIAGNAYVNVHTGANPAGEVRGQIVVALPTATVTALSATGSGGLADAGGGLAPIAAGALAGGLVLMLGMGARVSLRRRA